jgi:hypothetical protein
MNFEHVKQFLLLIGATNIRIDAAGEWVRCSCPLAPWLHSGGRDRNPSFGVVVPKEIGNTPSFHCFSCSSSGKLPKLLHNLTILSGDRLLVASNYLSQFEVFDDQNIDEKNERRRFKVTDRFASMRLEDRKIIRNESVPPKILAGLPLLAEKCDLTAHSDALLWLVRNRNLILPAIADFKLRLYVDSLADVGIVFPIISRDGSAVLDMHVRMTDRKRFFRLSRELTGSSVDYKAPNLWFGNHLYSEGRPLMLVEGPIDALRLYSLGISNVLASFGEPSDEQIASVYAPVIHLAYDADVGGRRMMRKLISKIDAPNIHIIDWEVCGAKDAGDLISEGQFRLAFDARHKIERAIKGIRRNLSKCTKASKFDWLFD